ncbi:MAG: gamma-glutamyltransferase [Micropepsaceae bacterium]
MSLTPISLLAALLLAACGEAAAPAAVTVSAPQPVTGWKGGAMVAAANPMAVEAGLEILRKGGSAVDAALAVQTVLGLVEPQSSGLGGGAFLIHYDAKTGAVTAYDGRETAPAGARPDMFLSDGKPMPFPDAVTSGDSIGTPGLVSLLLLAHADHGKLTVADDFAPAVKLASAGFPAPKRMAAAAPLSAGFYGPMTGDAAAYLFPGGTPIAAGQTILNPAYADTLTRIANEGAKGFYEGPVAEAMVAAARAGNRPGTLSLEDLKGFKARKLDALCGPYRALLVCGMGPPSSGGLAVLQTLGLLGRFDMAAHKGDATGWHLLIEAERLAYADRDTYAADDTAVPVPVAGLLDPAYLAERAKLISPDKAMTEATAGTPPGAPKWAQQLADYAHGTSHFVVVDASGNVVSMTTTIEGIYGSQRMAAGFFLNNEMTDFAFHPAGDDGTPIANAVAPGKRPRSSMSPTIVFRDGQFLLAVGSPGGSSIIGYVLKSLVAMLDWGMEPQAALALPNVVARGTPSVEAGFDPALREALSAMGQQMRDAPPGEGSGLHAIMVMPDGTLKGGADPRREGLAATP